MLLNLYWNYTHCWDNILFNLYNRNEGEEFSLGKVAIFFGHPNLFDDTAGHFLSVQTQGGTPAQNKKKSFQVICLAISNPDGSIRTAVV
ncbi:MAG: hypothetical protein WDM70_10175 [Nitrosomonadales bacterium]